MFKTLKFLRNKCLIFSTFLFLILVIYSCNPNNPDKDNAKLLKWQVLGTAGFSNPIRPNSDIANLAFDNKGIPYVAYRDYDNESKATVMKYDGSSWVNVGTAASSTEIAGFLSLAINNSGTPYIAYKDSEDNGYKATVMKFEGNTWNPVDKVGFSDGSVTHTSLAIDNNDIPYIAYIDISVDGVTDPLIGAVTVKKYNNNAWVDVASFAGLKSAYVRLAIDDNNTPYVIYLNEVSEKYKATVMKIEGNTWKVVGNENFAIVFDYATTSDINISLAFDNNDIAYVAYRDPDNSYKATVMKYDGGSWVNVGNAGFSAGYASDVSLAFDDRNAPYVAYEDSYNSYKATVMKYNGLYWGAVGSAGFSTLDVMNTSLVFYNNVPYVAYTEDPTLSIDRTKITVMKYDNRY